MVHRSEEKVGREEEEEETTAARARHPHNNDMIMNPKE